MAAPSQPNPDPAFNTPVTLFAKDATGGTLVLSLPLNAFVYDFRVAFARAFAERHDPNPATRPQTEESIKRTALLMFGGQQLENMRRLYEYGITKEATIIQILRMGPQRNNRNLPNPRNPAPFNTRRPTFANLKNIAGTRRRINTLMRGRKNLPEELVTRMGLEASQFAEPVHKYFAKTANANLKRQAVNAFLRENPSPTTALLRKTFSNSNFAKFPKLQSALTNAETRERPAMALSALEALRALSAVPQGASGQGARAWNTPRLLSVQPSAGLAQLLPAPGSQARLAELPQAQPQMMMRMATGGPPGQPWKRGRKSRRKTRRSK